MVIENILSHGVLRSHAIPSWSDVDVFVKPAEALQKSLSAMQVRAQTDIRAKHSSVLWALLHGRPMTCYEQLGLLTNQNSWGPAKGWSQSTGWRVATDIAAVISKHVANRVLAAPFMAFSLDESTDSAGECLH